MNILVSGGAGFIASHIVDHYIAAGHKIVVLDSLTHGFKENLHPKAKFYQVDLQDHAAIQAIVKKERPHIINHHAAIATVTQSVQDPIATFSSNVAGTINLLIAASQYHVKKFIFASTGGAMYGEAAKYPIAETVSPQPVSPYGLSKLLAEQAIAYYSRIGQFDYTIFRYPNVYGPRQDPHGEAGVIAIFSSMLAANKRPTIFGDGSKTRDYVYITDIVQANVLALTKGNNRLFHLGTGKEISDLAVYQTIAQYFPTGLNAKHKSVRPGEVVRSSLNAKKASQVLGWKPTLTFAQGVATYMQIVHNRTQ
jgi:UDP-glucose 4-epimerase